MELLCCNYTIDCSGGTTDWPTIISSIGAITIGIIALFISGYQSKKSLDSKKEEEERAEIHKKLDEFYGPLLQLRMKSNLLYNKFSEKFKAQDNGFTTLTYLLEGKIFEGNDATLLKEIIILGEQSEKLIHDKAGLIDDTNLRTQIIPRATTHFLILRLAYKQALKGETDKFRNLTFPKELDNLLEKRKKELEDRLKQLNKPNK